MEWLSELWASTADLRGSVAAAISRGWTEARALMDRAIPAVSDAWQSTADLRSAIASTLSDFGAWLAGFQLNLSRDAAIALATLLIALSLPSIVSAWVDRRFPRIGLVLLIGGCLLALWTAETYPGDYTWEDIPLAFIEVVAQILN